MNAVGVKHVRWGTPLTWFTPAHSVTLHNRFPASDRLEIRFAATGHSTPMGQYIDLPRYIQAENAHAGRVDARKYMAEQLRKLESPQRVLEMGYGPGALSTVDFAKWLPTAVITGMDLDRKSFKSANYAIRSMTASNITLKTGDILAHRPVEPYQAFIACGAFTDIQKQARPNFYEALKNHLLQPGGVFMVEEEVLPPFDPKQPDGRAKALWAHHGNVLLDAILQNQDDLIFLELQALWSGLKGKGDFKATLQDFMGELKAANLQQPTWKKVWPMEGDWIAQQNVATMDFSKLPSEGIKQTDPWRYCAQGVMFYLSKAYTSKGDNAMMAKAYHCLLDFKQRVRKHDGLYDQGTTQLSGSALKSLKDKLGLTMVHACDLVDDKNPITSTKDATGGVFVYSARTPN